MIVETIFEDQPEKPDAAANAADAPREQQPEERHRWLESMDEFADFIQNVDAPLPLREDILVALIDDGIDINEQSLHKRILDGRSFCPRDSHQNLNQPYYSTTSGHGTVMASLICRICPNAKLYIIKLNEHVNEQCKRQITAKSAAKVRFQTIYYSICTSNLTDRYPGDLGCCRQKSTHNFYVLDHRAYTSKH